MLAQYYSFLYTYVTNRSESTVFFDRLTIKYWKPVVRVQYNYYPYGLPWENPATSGEEALHDYLYQDKEFQFKDFADGDKGLMLYDFHARMYDPATAMWSVPDPAGQFANPYLAMGDNPVVGIDPDGQFVQFIIGAAVGAFAGAQYANAAGVNGWKRAGYILGGAAVGALTAGVGSAVAGSGFVAANTLAISFASTTNAVGMSILTQGNANVSVSFGVVSINSDGIGYLGKEGNSAMENIGYGLGAFANLTDAWAIVKGAYNSTSSLELQTDGHSQTYNPETGETFSWGAMRENGSRYVDGDMTFGERLPYAFKKLNPVTNYKNSTGPSWQYRTVNIKNVNMDAYTEYISNLPRAGQYYRMASFNPFGQGMHCTMAASNALLKAGVFNLPILRTPFLLDLQMRIRDYTYLSYMLTSTP